MNKNMRQPLVMQFILTIFAALGVERVVFRLRNRLVGYGIGLLWSAGWVVFLIVVWKPELTTRISDFFGVGRGVDAALYLAVAALLYLTSRLYVRIERQEHLISRLVTEITLDRHERNQKK